MLKNINKTILPIAAGVTIGLTVMATGGVIGSTVGAIINGSLIPMLGYLLGEVLVVGTSLCAITGLCYLSYKQGLPDDNVSNELHASNINVSEVIESPVNEDTQDCEVVIQGEIFENIDFH